MDRKDGTIKMNVNDGYVGWSMSRLAVEAYEDGEMPKE